MVGGEFLNSQKMEGRTGQCKSVTSSGNMLCEMFIRSDLKK